MGSTTGWTCEMRMAGRRITSSLMTRKALTLIELLVVVGIIGVLAVLVLLLGLRSVRDGPVAPEDNPYWDELAEVSSLHGQRTLELKQQIDAAVERHDLCEMLRLADELATETDRSIAERLKIRAKYGR